MKSNYFDVVIVDITAILIRYPACTLENEAYECWKSCLGPLVVLLPKTFKLVAITIFLLSAYLIKV